MNAFSELEYNGEISFVAFSTAFPLLIGRVVRMEKIDNSQEPQRADKPLRGIGGIPKPLYSRKVGPARALQSVIWRP